MPRLRKIPFACYLICWLQCRNVAFLLETLFRRGPVALGIEIFRTGLWHCQVAQIFLGLRGTYRRLMLLQLSVTRFPKSAKLNKWLGDCLCELHRYEDAVYAYGSSLRLGDGNKFTQESFLSSLSHIDSKNSECIEFALTSIEALLRGHRDSREVTYRLGATFLDRQQFERLVELTTVLLSNHANHPECLALRGLAYQQMGRYALAIVDLDRAFDLDPVLVGQKHLNLNRAYLRGLRGDSAEGFAALRNHYLTPKNDGDNAELAKQFVGCIQKELGDLKLQGSVGVFFGVFTTALGHAVLDPFHFYNLFAHRFDRLVMITPPQSNFSPATAIPLKILDQYVDRIESSNSDLLNLSWQNLGPLTHQNVTFLIHNYWGLNRMAFKARFEGGHPMRNRRQYFKPPPKISNQAERLCKRNGIDLNRPIVVLHARENAYHNLRGQSYRNTDILNYIPAIRRLIAEGYQVIRIGDKRMTSVKDLAEGVIELPSATTYQPILDPFLISRCQFMVSCQSGPCSYARIFGKPNLVVNAVYHFTLIPESNELIAFKNYVDMRTREPLSLEEIMRSGCHLFNNTEHFTDVGIEVTDMTPLEIVAAVDEMIAWHHDVEQPETASQEHFREIMHWHMMNPDHTNPLYSSMSDYIGYALPECRLSDAVTRMRPGYLERNKKGTGTSISAPRPLAASLAPVA